MMFKILKAVLLFLVVFTAVLFPAAQERPDAPIDKTASADEGDTIAPEAVNFSVLSGIPLEDMSSGTTQLIGPGSDNGNSAIAFMGLLLRHNGQNYTYFGANANGFIRLGGTAPSGDSANNAITSSANMPRIMPYWDDLCVSSAGKVHYKTTGAAGSRKLIVEWQNMKVPRGGSCDGSGNATFQLWIFEHSGVIQFVYGNNIGTSSANGGYTVGVSYTSSNFTAVTTQFGTAGSTANDTQTNGILAGTSYVFTPDPVAAPTNASVSEIRHFSQTLNWTDNANNETGFMIRRSTSGAEDSYVLAGTVPANSAGFIDTGLQAGTQYFYIVNAITDSAVSDDLIIISSTLAPLNVSSTASGGPWSSPSTWSSGVVPGLADNVTIAAGANVVIDTSPMVGSLTVGSGGAPATLRFQDSGSMVLTVTNDVTIEANSALTSGLTGVTATHQLSVGRNLINNGTLDLSTNNTLAGAGLRFFGDNNSVFGGTGPITNIRTITVSKSARAVTLEMNPANFTVQGSSVDTSVSGYLTMMAGTFKISGTFAGNHRTYPIAGYTLGPNAGIWLNNPNYAITGQDAGQIIQGSLRVSAGTYNVGTVNSSSMVVQGGASVTIEGGKVNITGGFGVAGLQPTNWSYNQTGGTITTCMTGANVGSNFACFMFGLSNVTGSLTGGEMVIQNPGPDPSMLDFWNESTLNVTPPDALSGTTLRFGNSFSPGNKSFAAVGRMPNVVIDSSGGNHTVFLFIPVSNGFRNSGHNLTIQPGGFFDLQSVSYTALGDVVNNGIIKANAGGSDFRFGDGNGQQITYSGSGITSIMTNITLACNRLTLDPAINNIRVRNINVWQGDLINTNKLILGNNDATVSTVTFGLFDTFSPTGTFDTAPIFDLGTGGQSVFYQGKAAGTPRTTGPEINPSRTLFQMSYNDGSVLTIAGGDLTITNSLGLPRGIIQASSGNKMNVDGAVTRTLGYITGPSRWRFVQSASFSLHVGAGGYSPVTVNVTALPVNPSYLSVTPVDTTLPGLLPNTAASRYWKLEETGDMAATLAFTYDQSDVNGTEANYKLWKSTGGPPVEVPGSTVNPTTNVVTSPTVFTDFNGDWGVGAQLDPSPVSISGSILTSGGAGIRNAIVTISGGNLPAPVVFQTGQFGTYSFSGLQAGETYTLTVSAKRYRFTPASQPVTPLGNLTNVNFVANPQEEF